MKSIPFRVRMWIPLAISLVCLTALSIFDAFEMREIRFEERRATLGAVTDAALNTIKDYAAKVQTGQLTDAEARKQAAERVRVMRYGDDGYFAIIDPNVTLVMHSTKPEMEGKSAKDIQDKDGIHMWSDAVALAQRDGEGFLRYSWPKPGASESVPKLSHVALYKPWQWTILTGVYLDDLQADFMRSVYRALLVLAGMATLLALTTVLLNRSLRRTLGGEPEYAARIADGIAGNDLSVSVVTEPDDRTSLLYSISRMQRQLKQTVTAIKTSADSIATASKQIAAGNLDLSQRTEEQAASLQQTAASMEELTSTVTNNTSNAHEGNRLASAAADVANRGASVVSDVVATMEAINSDSKQIAEIAGIIEGIAFQTNILALNAAVEAARAGEHGRGFAVVASEVRSLAQRSSAASKEVRDLIDRSVDRVRAGTTHVEDAGATMTQITEAIRRVTGLMSEIAAASEEQSKGIGQVNQAVSQMDQVTQQNAALVEEAAAATNALEAQAGGLRASTAVFVV
ncbi:methyl-accepting chemotaxis protein [Caballeronia grimmiae]|uniref:methyl-accepting chemotaxis protein n=1 Tax=Caballeronia grimmiae TaxID=1071679 RepID=UPI0038B92678